VRTTFNQSTIVRATRDFSARLARAGVAMPEAALPKAVAGLERIATRQQALDAADRVTDILSGLGLAAGKSTALEAVAAFAGAKCWAALDAALRARERTAPTPPERRLPVAGDLYAPLDRPDAVVTVTEFDVTSGTVRFHPEGGGFQKSGPLELFLATYAHVAPSARMNSLGRYRPAAFTVDGEGAPMPGYTNGQLWNGWQIPLFRREVIEQAVAGQRFGKREDGILVLADPERDAFYVFTTSGGEPMPDGLDEETALQAGRADAGEIPFPDGTEVWVGGCDGKDIVLDDGATVHAYPLGDGWCWQLAGEPRPSPAP
jgi:hypothetical protein